GVPGVPTRGPSTSAPVTAPGAPAPAGPDTTVIVGAVLGALGQLQAIGQVAQVKMAEADAQQRASSSAANLATVQRTQAGAQGGLAAARTAVSGATGKLSSIAVAAYTGAAYANPAANDPRPASNAFGLTGSWRTDAEEMISLITDQEKHNLNGAKRAVTNAQGVVAHAADNVIAARSALGAANTRLAAEKASLAQTLRTATVGGLAASATMAASSKPASSKPASSKPATSAPSTTTPPRGSVPPAVGAPNGSEGLSPQVLGAPAITAAEMAGWFVSTKHPANATVPVGQLATDYLAAGKATGVRGDLAFAQSIIETGYFSFPTGGQLVAADNNFAGIGACDSCAHGWTFPNAITGVTAQEQLLEAYASTTQVPTPLVGPVGVGGCCPTWTSLAGKWATDPNYGISILTVYKAMLDYAIPEQLVAAGLAPPLSAPPLPAVPAAPAGPVLPAVLPPTAPATTSPPKPPTLAPRSP
ncbi:MAG: glucosaminidase domain-containing protein, partial [Actinomycetota bacterium]|nr:glucosaminidase domain-containing protein [Actinomycetota bacterium]